MRYVAILTIASLHFGFGNSHADDPKKPLAEASLSTPLRLAAEQEQRVLHSLSQRIKVEAEDAPLIEVVQFISQSIDREILIETPALADAGISTDQNTTFKLGEMTVWQTLHFLLEPIQLSWCARDGVLEITTKEKADEQIITRVHDVRKLCELLEPISKTVLWQRHHQQRSDAGLGGGSGGGGLFSVPIQSLGPAVIGMGTSSDLFYEPRSSEPVSLDPMSIESLLANVIKSLTLWKWQETDGEGGSVLPGKGCLIVRQSYQGQFHIAGILEGLERVLGAKGQSKSTALRRIGYPYEEDAAILASLAKLKNLEIDDQSLEAALQQIGAEAGCRLLIDFPSLAEEGISSDQSLNCHLHKLPLGICLKKLLEPLQLTHVVDEGVLVITTAAKAEEMLSIRIYDVGNCQKITKSLSPPGFMHTLVELTSGKWEQADGEGGEAELISSKHLLVLQTQRVHSELELLVEELSVDTSGSPAKPEIELRVYTVPDIETAADFVKILPRILGKAWIENGSIDQAGKSLLISQTGDVHVKIERIIEALTISRQKQIPSSIGPVTSPTTNSGTGK
jgi:hypothetical protein